MGKTKWYSETETTAGQHGYRTTNTNATARARKPSYSPGRYASDNPDALPLPILFRQIWTRVRRSWVALRFRVNYLTFGFFKQRGPLKLAGLAASVYVLFFTNLLGGQMITSAEPTCEALATTFEVGTGGSNKSGKTVKWGTKNDAAPVSPKYLTNDMANDYVSRYSKIAITEMEKYGVPASISLAQGLIESRAGTSKLAVSNNNHFGIKCFSRHCRKGHCSNFTDDTHKDFFRKFGSPWESWRDHSRMISTGRYAKLKKYGRDYHKWAYGLKSVGYATDRTYAEKLIGIIEKHELYRYDR